MYRRVDCIEKASRRRKCYSSHLSLSSGKTGSKGWWFAYPLLETNLTEEAAQTMAQNLWLQKSGKALSAGGELKNEVVTAEDSVTVEKVMEPEVEKEVSTGPLAPKRLSKVLMNNKVEMPASPLKRSTSENQERKLAESVNNR